MKRVNIYTYSTAKSPKAAKTQCEAVGFVIEHEDNPGQARPQMKIITGMSWYQSELYVLERALSRLNTMYEVHVYTECPYVAAGAEKWIEMWKSNNWQTSAGKEVSNRTEWEELDKQLSKHDVTFHTKEDHSFRNWLKNNLEKEKARCLKYLENSIAQKK